MKAHRSSTYMLILQLSRRPGPVCAHQSKPKVNNTSSTKPRMPGELAHEEE